MSNSPITLCGNLTDDPELRFTPNGTAVCNIRMAVNDSYRDSSGEWQEKLNGFFQVTVWRNQAESCGQVLKKGNRIVVKGLLRNRSYEDKEGATRWVAEVTADEIGYSLLWHHLKNQDKSAPATQTSAPDPADDDVPF